MQPPQDTPLSPERETGRPKLKSKTLDGSAVDDRDANMQEDLVAPTEERGVSRRRGWRTEGEQGVPSRLEGMLSPVRSKNSD